MIKQNEVLLSLGSNLGNRKRQMESCISFIHKEIATVIKVSSLYETPAWGFDGNTFYNCVIVIHTSLSAKKLLQKLLFLEKQLGRVRKEKGGYQNRTIDIDILTFNAEIIQTEQLEIPHKELQNRKFVLQPLAELELQWEHPILKKSAKELVEICNDNSNCIKIDILVSPIQELRIKDYNYIAIEGNIGAGKTTLATKIAEDCNAKLLLERFADNPFLPKFYKDQTRYAFPLEMSFLADRYQQLTDDLAQLDLFKDFLIADYHIFKSLIFAKITLQEEEFRLYKSLFDIIYKEIPKPDLYIYLYQNTEGLLQNIKKRGRTYEQNISSEYLEKINRGYLDYIKTQTDWNVLILDVSDLDFIKNQKDYVFLLQEINNKIIFR